MTDRHEGLVGREQSRAYTYNNKQPLLCNTLPRYFPGPFGKSLNKSMMVVVNSAHLDQTTKCQQHLGDEHEQCARASTKCISLNVQENVRKYREKRSLHHIRERTYPPYDASSHRNEMLPGPLSNQRK